MKNIILTGGSGGIGNAIATDLYQEGYSVYNFDIVKPKNNGIFKDSFEIDLSQSSIDIECKIGEIISKINSIYGVVHSAGYGGPYQRITDVSGDEWRKIFCINVESLFIISKFVLPIMEGQNFGKIVAIASSLSIVGSAQSVAYSSSKHALVGFTRSIADEWGKDGITANCISPGYVNSKMGPTSDTHIQTIINKTPSKRIAEASEIARLVTFILNEKSGYINGANYTIDGGLTAI